MHWEDHFNIPPHPKISPETEDLIRSLITSADKRLGRTNGCAEIKAHQFFKGIDFTQDLRRQPAAWKPTILFPEDTSNFDFIEEDESESELQGKDLSNDNRNNRFYEFTFRRFFDEVFPPAVQHPVHEQNNANRSGDKANPVFV